MKNIAAVTSVILLLFSSAWAQELKVLKPFLFGKRPAKVKKIDSAAKKLVDADGFSYAFMVYVKNVSDHAVTVVTCLGQQTSPENPKQDVRLDLTKSVLSEDGSLIVPPREEFKLVELRPGEVTFINLQFDMQVPLEELTVTYNPQDFYGGRFGYWTGKVVSEVLKLEKEH